MAATEADWELRVSAVWSSIDDRTEADFIAAIEALVAERPEGDAAAMFEHAAALDSTGHSDLAVPMYGQALQRGLSGIRRRRAVIQMASSLRNIDRADESVALLRAEMNAPPDQLDDAVRAFLALALVDTGREREAVSLALTALAPHLPRYQRSLGNYARALVDRDASD